MTISPELLKKVGGVVVKPGGTPSPKPQAPVPSNGATLDVNKLNLNDGSLSVISQPKKAITGDAKKAIDAGKATAYNDYPTYKEATVLDKVDYALNPTTGANKHTIGWFNALAGTKALATLKDVTFGEIAASREATEKGIQKTQRIEQDSLFPNANSTKMMDTIVPTAEFNKLVTAQVVARLQDDTPTDKFIKGFAGEMKKTAEYYQRELEDRKLAKGNDPKAESFVEKVAEAAPSAEMFAAVALATGGASTLAGGGYLGGAIALSGKVGLTVTEAAMEADNARDQILAGGGTEEDAIKSFNEVFGANIILIAATNKVDKIWDVDTFKTLKQAALATGVAGIGEGFQEGVQQIISNTSTGRPTWEGVDEAFLIGAVLGGGIKGVTGVGGLSVENIKEELGVKGKDKVLEEIFNNPDIPQEKKDAVKEILGNPSEETVQGIMQDAFQDGSVQNFVNVQQQVAEQKTAEEEEMFGIYQQQVSAGIAPNVIFQEISDRTGIPVEDIKSTIQELETRPTEKDPIAEIASQLTGQANPITEKLETPEDKMKNLAEQTLQEDEQTAPNVIQDMENDAEMQADWENNYKVEYGDYNRQETSLRGLEQRYTQRAAKARVQAEISRVQAQKTALKEEYKKNNTEVTKADVEKAQKEKNPRKANRVLNQVGKEKTSKVVKNGKGVVRVNRITDTKKVTKKQLEKRAKAEGSFLDLKKDPTDLDTIDAIEQNQSDFVIENNIVKLSDVTESNPLDTTLKVGGLTFRFNTEEFQDFVNGRSEEELRYFVKGDTVYLIDTQYGDWNRNSIVGRVEYFEPQKSTLFQTSSRNRFATQKDIENAFNNIPFLKYIPVQRVSEIKTPGGGSAWGSYFEGLIKYTENPKYGTIPHEAFHAFVDLILTPQDRQNLFDLARIEMRKDGYASDMTNLQVEEYLAERFEDYYIAKTEKSPFRQWFDKIIDALKSLVQSKKTINDYYNSVFDYETGQLLKPNNEMMPIRGDFVVAMNPQSIEEAREIVDGAEISQPEKNFLMNILDNPAYAKKTDWEAFLEEVGIRTLQVEGKIQNGRVALIERGNEEIGLPQDTKGFAYLIKTDVEHGANTSHGFTDGADSIGWANVANTDGYYQVKEIQKISNRILEPELKNSKATPKQKEEILALNRNYMNAFVIGLRDMAANDFKVIKFPTVEKAKLVNPQMSEEVAEKVYGKELSLALEKFTQAEYEDDGYGGNWVVYPSNGAKMIAQRFQTADVFEAIQQENLTTKILNRLGDRKTVSKTFISDLAKMPDIKAKEKEIINEVLKGEPATINVEEFKQKVRAELLPLQLQNEIVKGTKSAVHDRVNKAFAYLESRSITMEEDMGGGYYAVDVDGNPLEYDEMSPREREAMDVISADYERIQNDEMNTFIPNKYQRISLPMNIKGQVANYDEHVYVSPIETTAGEHHYPGVDNYFGHTRIENMEGGETRRVIETQTDLYQQDRLDASLDLPYEVRELRSIEGFRNLAQIGLDQGKSEQEVFDGMRKAKPSLFNGINSLYEVDQRIAFLKKQYAPQIEESAKKIARMEQYGNPTAHFRMDREEVKRAAKDGIKKLQFPTGITALKIEGHWDRYAPTSNTFPDHGWTMYVDQNDTFSGDLLPLRPTDLKAGLIVKDRYNMKWIVVYIKPTGEMVAVKYNKQFIEEAKEQDPDFEGTDFEVGQRHAQSIFDHIEEDPGSYYGAESFNIGAVKTSDEYKKNPLYKFYEGDQGKYLKNTFGAKEVTDAQGVTWFEIALTPEMAGRVEAFQKKTEEDKLMEEARKYKTAEEFSRSVKDKIATELVEPRQLKTTQIGGVDEEGVNYFVDKIKNNLPIEKLEVTPNFDGTYNIQNGHNRFEAYKKSGVKEIPVDVYVTKSQLTDIWNKANTKVSPLAEEARKYKSAEEFVRAMGANEYSERNVVRKYLGTYSNSYFDFPKLSEHSVGKKLPETITVYRGVNATNPVDAKIGLHWTTDKEYAKQYGKNIQTITAPKSDFRVNTLVPSSKDFVYLPKGTPKSKVVLDNEIPTLTDIWNKANTKFQEKDMYDRMGELLLKIKGEAARTMKKETLIERIAEEIDDDLKGGFYTPQIIRQELAKSAALYEENPELAINIAKGLEDGPDNINYLALGRYVLYQVTQQGRAEDQIDVINNISKQARKAGQAISMLRGLLTIDSPNQYVNQLQSFKNDLARKNFKALFTRSKSVVVEDLVEDEVRKTKRKKSTKDLKEKLLKEKEFELDSFLNALAC